MSMVYMVHHISFIENVKMKVVHDEVYLCVYVCVCV